LDKLNESHVIDRERNVWHLPFRIYW